jgi:hypothetical protein
MEMFLHISTNRTGLNRLKNNLQYYSKYQV